MFEISLGATKIAMIDPVAVKAAMEKVGLDSSIISKCNSLELKHGPTPGRCHFLVSKADFDALVGYDATPQGSGSGSAPAPSIETSYLYPNVTVTVKDNFKGCTGVDFKKWTLAEAVNVLGHPDNPDAVVYLILEDMRHWTSKEATRVDFFGTSYNKLRHTPKNIDTDPPLLFVIEKYFYETLNSDGSLYDVNGIFNSIHSRSQSVTEWQDSDFLENYYFLDFVIGHKTILELYSKTCEVLRCYYYVDKDGKYQFEAEKFDPSDLNNAYIINQMKNLMVYPGDPNTEVDDLKYRQYDVVFQCYGFKFYNNESDIATTMGINGYPTVFYKDDYAFNYLSYYTENEYKGSLQLNLPYHYKELPDNDYYTFILNDIESRVRTHIHPKISYRRIKGYFAYTPRFEADRIVYANYGQGLITEIIGEAEHELNYLTPEFDHYEKELIREKWKYTLKTKFTYPEGYSYGYATADIFYPIVGDPRRTSITLYDLTKSLKHLNVGATGVCNQVGAYYYAECCAENPSSSSISADPCGCGSSQVKVTISNAPDIVTIQGTRTIGSSCDYLEFAGFSGVNGTYYVDWPALNESVELGRWVSSTGPLTDAFGTKWCVYMKLMLKVSDFYPCNGLLWVCINSEPLVYPTTTCTDLESYPFNLACMDVTPGASIEFNDFQFNLCIPDNHTISLRTTDDSDCEIKTYTFDISVAPV